MECPRRTRTRSLWGFYSKPSYSSSSMHSGSLCKNKTPAPLKSLQQGAVGQAVSRRENWKWENFSLLHDNLKNNLWNYTRCLTSDQTFPQTTNTRTATGMDGTLPHCIFENLKPVEITKNLFQHHLNILRNV